AVGAPLVAGAVTAALVLAPSPDAETVTAATRATAPASSVSTAAPAPPADPADPVVVAAIEPPAPSAPDPAPPPAAPAVDAGPVDVYLGPEGVDRAADEAEEMPLRSDLGHAFAGLDPRPALASLGDQLTRTLDPLLGGTP